MVSFPNAKINLGLNIVEKRSDGFHNLETVFLPIEIQDVLEVIVDEKPQSDFEFTSTGLKIEGDISCNLCVRAYKLLKKNYSIPPIKMNLHKAIPMGAGLGGGSADGAFALKLLNDKFLLNISNEQLLKYALQLGSDCPFFILNKTCFATSRGEILNEIELDLSAYHILIINPCIHIATAWAFSQIHPYQPTKSIKEIIQQPLSTWKNELVNDFELSVQKKHPIIKNIKDTLYQSGALYASLTGTGSTIFGIFNNKVDVQQFNFPEHYFIKWVSTL
jgi:4-diphosphocytidyl-2-C-methyl-D-erythritol kinase